MSRLYGKLTSDKRKIDAAAGANYKLDTLLTFGSAYIPKTLLHAEIVWYKDMPRPMVRLGVSKDIDLHLWHGDDKILTDVKD